MGKHLLGIFAVFVTLVILSATFAQDGKVFFREEFNDLEHWKPLHFDIIKDYRMAFGDDPPSVGSLAIMSDSDNTEESAVSCIDYIEVFR